MRHVRKNIANFPADVVAVRTEELQDALHERIPHHYCLDLVPTACRDIGEYPTGLSPHYFLVVIQYLLQQTEDVMVY